MVVGFFASVLWRRFSRKDDEQHGFVPKYFANDYQHCEVGSEMNQNSSVVILDDGGQLNLCPFIESEVHSPDFLLQCVFV